MKKMLMTLALGIILVGSVFANGSNEDQSKSKSAAPSNAVTKSDSKGEYTLPIVAEPTEFTIYDNFYGNVFDSNWAVFQEYAKRTNISLKSVIALSNSDEEKSFNLMLSSGKLPDIISYKNISDLEKLGRDGGMMPLNDLIKQYAPHIQWYLDNDSAFKSCATALDGNIYFIPQNPDLRFSRFYWLRQDWLDDLGLQIPTTVDELYDVLTAFRNEDPNGNGKKDEIPVFQRQGDLMPGIFLNLWNTSLSFYATDNGKIIFDPLEPDFEVGVSNFAKWYAEGLVDPEFFTRGKSARDTLFSGNQSGFTLDWPSTGDYNSKLADIVPGFDIEGIAPPKDQHGNIRMRDYRSPSAGWGISAQCSDPVAIIKYMDYIFTTEGSDLINWGFEGEEYTVDENGEKVFTDKVLNADVPPLTYLRTLGCQYRIGRLQDGKYEFGFMSDASKKVANLYDSHKEWYDAKMPPINLNKINLKVLPEDDANYKQIMSNITPYVLERYQAWVMGTRNFEDDYPAFKKELKKRGIDEAIDILQRGYDKYLGK